MTKPADSLKVVRVVAALVEQGTRYLVTQRRAEAVLPDLWEFPGGKVEAGESDVEALRRELQHRLAVTVEVKELLSFVSHPYEKYCVELFLYRCELTQGTPINQAVQAHQWVTSSEFENLAFTAADEASMSQLLNLE